MYEQIRVKDAITYIADKIKLDYTSQYEKNYKDDESVRAYKNNLLDKLKGREGIDIQNGYDDYVLSANPFLPTLPNLIIFINSAEKERLRAINNYAEVSSLTALPPPAIIKCDPVEMLIKAKQRDDEYTPEERKIKHEENKAKHQALLTKFSHRIKRIYADQAHLCAIPGCNNAGSISQSNHGGGNFYCSLHWRLL